MTIRDQTASVAEIFSNKSRRGLNSIRLESKDRVKDNFEMNSGLNDRTS